MSAGKTSHSVLRPELAETSALQQVLRHILLPFNYGFA